MKKTKNYAMPYPEQDDYFNVEDFQDMMVSVDDLMKKLSDSGAQISSDAEHLYNQTKAQMDNIQKRMNAFTALKEGSTTGDAELKDIRVAYDGKKYGNAGEAVREQASDIHKALFGAGASIWSKAKSESTKYVAETKGICILNERFTAAGVVTKISRGTFAENESTLNLDRECSAYIVEFEKNPGTVYMPSAETIKIVSTTKIIFEANGNARCWIPVEKGQYLAVDSTATAYTSESNHVPYMLYDQANKTLECRGFGSAGSIEPVDPYSLALEYKLEYDMDDTGLVKQIDANREAAASLKEDIVEAYARVYSVEDIVGINEGFSEIINLPYFLTTSDNTGTVTGENIEIWNIDNIFDKDSIKTGYRYNDSGQEVADPTGAYQIKLVPICLNGYIHHNQSSSFVQRVYTFDKDKNFISRANGLGDGTQQISLPSNTAYISFQFNSTTLNDDVLNTFQVTFSDSYNDAIPTSYKPFSADRPASKLYKNARNFIRSFASDTASITGRVLANEYTERRNKLFTTIDIWEPSNVDSDYSNPTSGWGKDTKREDWAATDKYLYYDFLSHYYDTYIGIAENGYKVTKRSLGQDSANTGHELFEYDFCPVNYKYTVMLSAGMNADETQGIWGLATFIKCLMDYEEENLKLMHDNIRFKVIPIINASGFDESTLRYDYSDGVNPNFNFNYKDSWAKQTATNKGVYPDSNISTKMLKRWINENAWKVDLWIDLHTGRWVDSDANKYIADVRVADDSMRQPFNAPYMDLIRKYYTDKGYITSSDNIGGTICIRDNLDYQKTVYAYDVCGIKSVMSEMHIESTGYGSDGYTNNSAEGIKCYVAQIRAMVMCYINESTQNTFAIDSIKSDAFHSRYR